LKEEAVVHTVWTALFGKGCGPLSRQVTQWINEQKAACACNGGCHGVPLCFVYLTILRGIHLVYSCVLTHIKIDQDKIIWCVL